MLLLRQLLIVLLVRLLDHLGRSVLGELLVVLLCFLLWNLPIGTLIPVVRVLLIHLLIILVNWPHDFSPYERKRGVSFGLSEVSRRLSIVALSPAEIRLDVPNAIPRRGLAGMTARHLQWQRP